MPGQKAIILVGGSSKGTRFRPLSFDLPKPLFPVGGEPMLTHHIAAAVAIPSVTEILLLGFYPEKQFTKYIAETSKRFNNIPIRYLAEEASLGTAGGLYKFRHELLRDEPDNIFLMHVDVLCTFPLGDLLKFHQTHSGMMSILTKRVPEDEARHYGCLVATADTHELKHYAEKPESFVSPFINCGIYVVRAKQLHSHLERAAAELNNREVILEALFTPNGDPLLRLEQDIIVPAAGHGEVFVFETTGFWIQLKKAGTVVPCSLMLLQEYRRRRPELLASSTPGGPAIVGDVVVASTAKIDKSAKLGPNVTIGEGVVIRSGVRVKNAIILAGTELQENCCVMNAVLGRDCVVGKWARIEGVPTASPHQSNDGITIFGHDVTSAPEIVVRDCIVLPHKTLGDSCSSEILL